MWGTQFRRDAECGAILRAGIEPGRFRKKARLSAVLRRSRAGRMAAIFGWQARLDEPGGSIWASSAEIVARSGATALIVARTVSICELITSMVLRLRTCTPNDDRAAETAALTRHRLCSSPRSSHCSCASRSRIRPSFRAALAASSCDPHFGTSARARRRTPARCRLHAQTVATAHRADRRRTGAGISPLMRGVSRPAGLR